MRPLPGGQPGPRRGHGPPHQRQPHVRGRGHLRPHACRQLGVLRPGRPRPAAVLHGARRPPDGGDEDTDSADAGPDTTTTTTRTAAPASRQGGRSHGPMIRLGVEAMEWPRGAALGHGRAGWCHGRSVDFVQRVPARACALTRAETCTRARTRSEMGVAQILNWLVGCLKLVSNDQRHTLFGHTRGVPSSRPSKYTVLHLATAC